MDVNSRKVFVIGSFVAASAVKVERLPSPGESLTASSFALEAGGKGFNLAVASRRLGAAVDGVLPIGDDLLSGLALPALARAELDPAMLCRFPGATGAGIGFIDADGENCLAVFPGANNLLSAENVASKAASIRAADIILAQFETGSAAIEKAFEIARDAGKPTLLNPSPYRKIDARLLQLTAILVVNETELERIASELNMASRRPEEDPIEATVPVARYILSRGPQAIVVTFGRRGAVLFRPDEIPYHQPAFRVETIDTLGAGDGFAAGLAVAIAEGMPWPIAMKFAAACGAIVAGRWGVFDAFPTRTEVEDYCNRDSSGPTETP